MPIKTPDQKLRVFVSSTIEELADERRVARDAISKLRLIPVLFEMGARPHPPRELYRAYLEQSQIFIGCYGNSYGWIAPDMNMSGIEDEFNLSKGKPRLIYVKQSSARDPRLDQLLDTIRRSDSACYQKFSTAEQLKDLIENDLAILLSEKFETDHNTGTAPHEGTHRNLPIIRSQLIGRETELNLLKEILGRPEVGLITLTGAGGTGKTRLSLQLLYDVENHYKDGAYFVSLGSLTDSTLVPATIADELGLVDTGKQPILNTLTEYLSDKKAILLLDNFEQVTDAAFSLSKILERCPRVKFVVTSRTPLYLRGEWLFPLAPLSNPSSEVADSELDRYPAIQLFIQRAKEVNPNLCLDAKNLQAISAICRRLDGLPLAIELAAARTKFLPPVLLLDKMKKVLDLLSQGPKDLPLRQQTIRATMDWSINLLDDCHRRFFRKLAIFSDSWSLEASEAIARWDQPELNVGETTERLIDLGLVQSYSHEVRNEEIEIRFRMLQTVREYAYEMLTTSSEFEKTKGHHIEYFVAKADELLPMAWVSKSFKGYDWFEKEFENLRLAFTHSLGDRKLNSCWKIFGCLTEFWVRQGGFSEAFEWMKLAGISIDAEKDKNYNKAVEQETRARAYFSAGVLHYFAGNYRVSSEYLTESDRLFSLIGNLTELARSKSFLGLAKLNLGDIAASDLTEAIQLGRKTGDPVSILLAPAFVSEALMAAGQYEKARILLDETDIEAKELDNVLGQAMVALQKANLHYELNEFSLAVHHFVKSIALYNDAGFEILNGWCYINLGGCLTELKRFDEARSYLEKGLENARVRGEKPMLLVDMLYFSILFYALGDYSKAVKVSCAVEALRTRINAHPIWSTISSINKKVEQFSSECINNPSYVNDAETGKQLSLEQLIALVLEDDKRETSVER